MTTPAGSKEFGFFLVPTAIPRLALRTGPEMDKRILWEVAINARWSARRRTQLFGVRECDIVADFDVAGSAFQFVRKHDRLGKHGEESS